MGLTAPSIQLELNDYRGLSAYQIAVKNGFEGSETEWLESLKGAPGKDGDSITVNRKRAVDGNISVNATDIPFQPGASTTVAQKFNELTGSGLLKEDAIVNDLTTGGETKVLSAEMGAVLQRTKTITFGAVVQIPVDGWQGEGPYIIDLDVGGVTADEVNCHVQMSPHPDYEEAVNNSTLRLIAQGDGKLTFRAETVPVETFPVNVLVHITGVNA